MKAWRRYPMATDEEKNASWVAAYQRALYRSLGARDPRWSAPLTAARRAALVKHGKNRTERPNRNSEEH